MLVNTPLPLRRQFNTPLIRRYAITGHYVTTCLRHIRADIGVRLVSLLPDNATTGLLLRHAGQVAIAAAAFFVAAIIVILY